MWGLDPSHAWGGLGGESQISDLRLGIQGCGKGGGAGRLPSDSGWRVWSSADRRRGVLQIGNR